MRSVGLFIIMSIPVGCASSSTSGNGTGGAKSADAKENDNARFQGKWAIVSAESNGKAVPADEIKDVLVMIEGDKFSFIADGKKRHGKLSFSLDSSKSPKQIDFTESYLAPVGASPGVLGPVHHVEEKSDSTQGVYELNDDTLTICKWNPGYRLTAKLAVGAADEGKPLPRPVSLAPADRNGITILILKRIK